jgi:hypothetical protein
MWPPQAKEDLVGGEVGAAAEGWAALAEVPALDSDRAAGVAAGRLAGEVDPVETVAEDSVEVVVAEDSVEVGEAGVVEPAAGPAIALR